MKTLKTILTCAGVLILAVLMIFCILTTIVFLISALCSCVDIGIAVLVVRELDYLINCLGHTLGLIALAAISGVVAAVCCAGLEVITD